MFRKIYLALGMGVVLLYGVAAFQGWELGNPERQVLPPEARSAGGYRSFHFWHYGFRGGK